MSLVLVTGGNGHLGYNLVKILSNHGYQVRATIRDLNDESRTRHVRVLKNVELVEADLMNPESLERAMQGVQGVFHSAAPNLPWSPDPVREIIQPTLKGTQNVFEAAKKAQVKKIIFTSSCGACGMDSTLDKPLTELDWNFDSKSALVKSKIDSECWAWNFCRENQMDLVTIHPPSIVGPGFFRHTSSTQFYEKVLLGKLPPLPEGGCHLVDVRDLAEVHMNAYANPQAKGRYIVASRFFKLSELMRLFKRLDPKLRIPSFQLPVWTLHGIRFVDWALYKIFGRPRELTGELIQDFVGKYQHVSTKKAEAELNWKPRPVEETILDTFQWIREMKLNKVSSI